MTTVAKLFETMEYGPAPESDAPALEWIKQHDSGRFGHFINGVWASPSEGTYFETINPATKAVLARVAQGSKTDIDAAVAAGNAAAPGWAALQPHARARYLYALAREVQRHSRLLAVLESLDNGKPIRETRDLDIPLVARHFYHHAGWAQLRDTEFPGYVPVGVVGQIIPWNFPLLMVAWKVAPALAAGNTVILKPAEFTPLTALCFAEIARDAGLPAGVFNVVTGDGTTGKHLVEHPGVQKIAFTGSTEVGRIIRKATAGTGKKLTLELGGKSPFIVPGRRPRQRRRRCGGRDLVQPGPGLLRGLAAARPGRHRRSADAEAARPDGEAPRRLAARQSGGHGRDRGPSATRAHSRTGREGRRGRRENVAAVVGLSDGWLFLSADVVHRRFSRRHDRADRDLRPRARQHDVPDAAGGGRAREQHAVRSRGKCLD